VLGYVGIGRTSTRSAEYHKIFGQDHAMLKFIIREAGLVLTPSWKIKPIGRIGRRRRRRSTLEIAIPRLLRMRIQVV